MFTIFTGGDSGLWSVASIKPYRGATLAMASRLDVSPAEAIPDRAAAPGAWRLTGVASYGRYTHRSEKNEMNARQEGLGRPHATSAALLPIRKNAAWWDLTQDERRAIFEEQSQHLSGSLKYLPAIARKLYQSRDLGEPFDFLTWFEFAPADSGRFDELLEFLRGTEEWKYVEREVDIRLTREPGRDA